MENEREEKKSFIGRLMAATSNKWKMKKKRKIRKN